MTVKDNVHPFDLIPGFVLTGCDLTNEEKDNVLEIFEREAKDLDSGDNSARREFDTWCEEMDETLSPVLEDISQSQ